MVLATSFRLAVLAVGFGLAALAVGFGFAALAVALGPTDRGEIPRLLPGRQLRLRALSFAWSCLLALVVWRRLAMPTSTAL